MLLLVLAFLMLFPFVYVIAVSFSSYKDVVGGGLILFPAHPTLEAYNAIFKGGIVTHALTSASLLTLIGTAINMFMTVTMAYGLSRPGVPGSRFVLALVLFTLLFSAGISRTICSSSNLGLIDTFRLAGAAGGDQRIQPRHSPPVLHEPASRTARERAARWRERPLDAAPDHPATQSKPVLAVVALFYGVAHWNDFFAATLYLNDAHKWPIQLVLRQYVLQGSALANAVTIDPSQPPPPAQTIQMAVVVIATVPILIVYPFLQRYFTRGVLTGAIKG